MSILIALIPALAWGSVGIVTTKMGGTAAQGTLGMTFGALLFALATFFGFVVPTYGFDFAMNPRIWVVGFLSGLAWAVGTAGQFVAFKKLGVSVGNPLSTAGQIVANALLAASLLGEWTSAKMWIFGLLAIAAIALGAVLTALPDRDEKPTEEAHTQWTSGGIALLISTIGYMMYFIIPNLLRASGFITEDTAGSGLAYMTGILGPQAIGQVLGAIVIVVFFMKEGKTMFEIGTWRNMLTGIVWGIGNLFMFISASNPNIGQATAATFSQLGVIVGTYGGIYLLGEKKTKRQMRMIFVGTILIVVGAIVISNLGMFK